MVDTHCHVFSEYYDNIDDLIDDIVKSGVEKIIVNGFDMSSNKEVLDLVKKYDIVYGALGFHPTEAISNLDESLKFLTDHINDNKIVAIGEIGLDYHYDNTDKEFQKILFKRQLDIASFYDKPIIVHSRDAIKDTYDILSLYSLKGSIHAYSGSLEMAKEFVKLGYYLGIGGVATYKNAKNIISVIEEIDLTKLLLETDSPYLPPVPYRGQINKPSYIIYVANKISEVRKQDLSFIKRVTTDNANRLFDF